MPVISDCIAIPSYFTLWIELVIIVVPMATQIRDLNLILICLKEPNVSPLNLVETR